mmetsp:Transcript_46078/g.106388  ORF Transcript_46078/g.106388 Transcript_46078/m.106388 type:complete len:391 (-) Transcript_46078:631-1803(-)
MAGTLVWSARAVMLCSWRSASGGLRMAAPMMVRRFVCLSSMLGAGSSLDLTWGVSKLCLMPMDDVNAAVCPVCPKLLEEELPRCRTREHDGLARPVVDSGFRWEARVAVSGSCAEVRIGICDSRAREAASEAGAAVHGNSFVAFLRGTVTEFGATSTALPCTFCADSAARCTSNAGGSRMNSAIMAETSSSCFLRASRSLATSRKSCSASSSNCRSGSGCRCEALVIEVFGAPASGAGSTSATLLEDFGAGPGCVACCKRSADLTAAGREAAGGGAAVALAHNDPGNRDCNCSSASGRAERRRYQVPTEGLKSKRFSGTAGSSACRDDAPPVDGDRAALASSSAATASATASSSASPPVSSSSSSSSAGDCSTTQPSSTLSLACVNTLCA